MKTISILSLLVVSLAGCGDPDAERAPWPDAASASGGSGGTAGSDGGGQSNSDGCEKAGGQCECAGSCTAGSVPAEGGLLFACPQGPPGSGMCGMQCCLPELDAGADAEPDNG